MDIEAIRTLCKKHPFVTEGVKWGNDLCFMVGEKMFCVVSLDTPFNVALKVPDDEFETLTNIPGIIPAPYVARYKWVLIEDTALFPKKRWTSLIAQSYELVRAKLSKKAIAGLK